MPTRFRFCHLHFQEPVKSADEVIKEIDDMIEGDDSDEGDEGDATPVSSVL